VSAVSRASETVAFRLPHFVLNSRIGRVRAVPFRESEKESCVLHKNLFSGALLFRSICDILEKKQKFLRVKDQYQMTTDLFTFISM
jgi:hypothetical protein